MQNISTLFIQSFRNFSDFKMTFPKKDEILNLNVLIGRNGSGKSNLLDALFNIATTENLNYCDFEFYLKNYEDNLILANIDPITKDKKIYPELEDNETNCFWHKVVRFHCSNNPRNKENYLGDELYVQNSIDDLDDFDAIEDIDKITYKVKRFTNKCFDFTINDSKFAYIAYILSGQYFKDEEKGEENLWKKLNSIVIEEKLDDSANELSPEMIWIDAHSGNTLFDELKPEYCYSTSHSVDPKDGIVYYWKVDDLRKYYETNEVHDPKKILEKYFNDYCYDMGFFYRIKNTQNNNDADLMSSSTLSDGQRALIYRFAIVNLLKNESKKCLLLLDEPETYFNEYWKSYFIYLVNETLKDKPHDVFISTHSAMLITDAKSEEIHRLVNTPQGAYHCRPQINTYGVNVVDIGKYLFMMESDIGNRSKADIIKAINNDDDLDPAKHKGQLVNLLRQVGAGEWRWRLRIALKEVEKELQKVKAKEPTDEQ